LPLPFYVKAVVPQGFLPGTPDALGFAQSFLLTRADLGLGLLIGLATLRARVLPIAIGALSLWLFFFVPAHEMGYDFRYFHLLVPVLAAPIGVGLAWLSERIAPLWWLVVPLTMLVAIAAIAPNVEASLSEKRDYAHGIERAHARIGHTLATFPDGKIACLDTGSIAYYSRWTVLDTWGLNDPEIAISGRRDAGTVLAQNPELIIVISSRGDRFVAQFENERALYAQALAAGYAHVASFEFVPDYRLFVLARPGSRAGQALARAGGP